MLHIQCFYRLIKVMIEQFLRISPLSNMKMFIVNQKIILISLFHFLISNTGLNALKHVNPGNLIKIWLAWNTWLAWDLYLSMQTWPYTCIVILKLISSKSWFFFFHSLNEIEQIFNELYHRNYSMRKTWSEIIFFISKILISD